MKGLKKKSEAAVSGEARGRRLTIENKRSLWGLAFISPWVIGIVVFFVLPMIQSVIYSFSKINVTPNGFETEFVGAENFSYFFTQDTFFLQYLTESIVMIIPETLLIVCFSMFIAVLLKQKFLGRTLARAVFFFPVIIASGVVITILKEQVMMSGSAVTSMQPGYMFKAPDMVDVFATLGLPDFLLTAITSVVNEIFDLTWKSGVQILLLLAAVNNIPSSSYEVADMEGATGWEKFWKITFPMMAPTLLVAIIYTIIDGFTDYGNKVMQMLNSFYSKGDYEYSATIGVIYFVCVLLVIGLVELIASRTISYSTD